MAETDVVAKKDGMLLPVTEQIERFKEFFEEIERRSLLGAISSGRKSIAIDFARICAFDTKLAIDILDYPEEIIKAAERSITELELPREIEKFRVRIFNLPDAQKLLIREIRSSHIGKFIVIEGIVRKKSDVRPQLTKTDFECPNCGRVIMIFQTEQTYKEPKSCGCGRKGNFREIDRDLLDAQSMVLEESPEMLEGGDQPKRLGIFLKEDLVSPISEKKTNPGNHVKIAGVLKNIPVVKQGNRTTSFDFLIDANHIETKDEDFYEIRISKDDEEAIIALAKDPNAFNKLVTSIAPSIYGHEKVKEALVLQLMGGVQKKRSDGVTSRGDIHILLVGDPGSGKSQMLKRISIIAPKGRYVSGGGISGAGITAAVVKDEILGGWSLEAGALVLANNGICCTTGDTKFIREDGKLQTFEELFKNEAGSVIHPSFKVLGLELETLKIKPFPIRKAFRIKNLERTFEITTRTGRKINLTEFNEILVPENSDFLWKPVGKVSVGSYLAVPKDLPVVGADIYSENFAYLCGLIFTDGHISLDRRRASTSFYNTEPALVEVFKEKMKELGFSFSIYRQKSGRKFVIRGKEGCTRKDCFKVYNSRKEFAEAVNRFGVPVGEKSSKMPLNDRVLTYSDLTLANFLKGVFDGDGSIRVRNPAQVVLTTGVYETALLFQTCLSRLGIISSVKRSTNSWHCEVTGIRNCASFFKKVGTNHPQKAVRFHMLSSEQEKDRIDILPNHSLFFKSLRTEDRVTSHNLWHYRNFNAGPSRQRLLQLNKQLLNAYLEKYLQSDIFWDKIVEIKEIAADYVYDFTMEGTNNFVANNIIMHNCIDEMDKMEEGETGAMHEALEQQQVSIAKASIQATLLARTTVLAAANPKYGRFDQYGNIAEQINLPPTLINRFDLIFTIRDLPQNERDAQTADHILKLHQAPNLNEPEISTDFLKKYISYARQKVRPVLTDEAIEEIRNFYVQLRNSKTNDEKATKAIPISARQLEALVRMSEASAKIRLSDKVTKDDASKAIELLMHCLREVGMDRETGQIDIDRIQTGIPTSQRNKMLTVKQILEELEAELGKTIPVEDVARMAVERGISKPEVDELIEKLKRTGDVYEPRLGFLSRV